MSRPRDSTKTLNELEPPARGRPEYDSYLATTCQRLRDKPIGDFSIEDLRIMIGQGIGLRYLVPLALEVVEQDPLAEGDFYPGDLLGSMLRVDAEFWGREKKWRDRILALLQRLPAVPKELSEAALMFRAATA